MWSNSGQERIQLRLLHSEDVPPPPLLLPPPLPPCSFPQQQWTLFFVLSFPDAEWEAPLPPLLFPLNLWKRTSSSSVLCVRSSFALLCLFSCKTAKKPKSTAFCPAITRAHFGVGGTDPLSSPVQSREILREEDRFLGLRKTSWFCANLQILQFVAFS